MKMAICFLCQLPRVWIFIYPTFQDQHKITFYVKFSWFEFSFLSPRLVTLPRLKIPVCHTIYSSSNLDKAVCISLYSNAFGKGMNPFLFPQAMSK